MGAEPAAAHPLDPPAVPAGLRGAAQHQPAAHPPPAHPRRRDARLTSDSPRAFSTSLWILVVLAVAVWAAWLTVTYIATEVSWDEVAHVFVLTLYTLIRVFLLILLGDDRLGADQRLDRLEAPLGGGRPADRPVPRRLPGQPPVRRDGQPDPRLQSQPEHLAELPHHLRHAMVHRVQHDRRRRGLPQRPARRRRRISASRAGAGGRRSCCPASRPII